jgi:DNA-binding CsgD family transcriptional regulator
MSGAYTLVRQRCALGLTHRQEAYLRGVCAGRTMRQVAALESVSVSAVKWGLSAVYRHLGLTGGAGDRPMAQACARLREDAR